MDPISTGNFKDITKKRNNPWVIGHFIETGAPFCINDFEVKWSSYPKGESKDTVASNTLAKSLSVLISGKVSFKFPDNSKEIILCNQGDYIGGYWYQK